jgi:hypothetical protein
MALAVAMALPVGDSCTPMPVDGRPLSRARVPYDCAPSSMRATSFRRTVEPSALARSTMAPNWSTDCSCPRTTTVANRPCPGTLGRSPMVPEATCAFCAAMAALTSAADSR